jgi:hypothetical protein
MPLLPVNRTERDTGRYQTYNVSDGLVLSEDVAEYFTLTAAADTKIWRGNRDVFSAPMVVTKPRPVQSFHVIEVTVTVAFTENQDQAGLVLFFDMTPDQPWYGPSSVDGRRRRRSGNGEMHHTGRWATAALRQVDEDQVDFVTAVTRPGCEPDRSSSYFRPRELCTDAFSTGDSTIRIKIERVDDKLWVSYRPEMPDSEEDDRSPEYVEQSWRRVREVDGFFNDLMAKRTVMVGCYAGRPLPREYDEGEIGIHLVAEFENLSLLESL